MGDSSVDEPGVQPDRLHLAALPRDPHLLPSLLAQICQGTELLGLI